jgi:hypothetical protein
MGGLIFLVAFCPTCIDKNPGSDPGRDRGVQGTEGTNSLKDLFFNNFSIAFLGFLLSEFCPYSHRSKPFVPTFVRWTERYVPAFCPIPRLVSVFIF